MVFPTGAGTGPIGEGIIVNKEGEYELDRRPDGAIRFALKDPSSPMVWTVTPLVAPEGSWTHVALVFDSGAIKIYGNGSLVQSYAGPSVLGDELPAQNDFRIGGRQMLSECFKGLIDEVAVFRRALTANEIQSIYAAGSAGKCLPQPPLVCDLATEFSTNSNPNGLWSYGYSTTLGGPMTLHASRGFDAGIEIWYTDLWLNQPSVSHNPTAGWVTNNTGTIALQPGQLSFHPGPNGEYGLIRFTAPTNGDYQIVAAFSGADTHGTTTDVFLMQNGSPFFGGLVNGFGAGSGPAFQTNLTLRAGDHLDFAVRYGSNQEFSYDSTGLSAQITLMTSPPANTAPALVTQPQSQTVAAGSNVTFTVSATGTWPLSYQWFFNNALITGATKTSLSLSNVQPAQAGPYAVIVTNAYGAVTSSNADLTVLTYPPTITQQPQNVTAYQGRTVSFTSRAAGTAPLAYQWFFKGDALPGKTMTALALTNVQFSDAGNYWLVATNAYGSATSSNALLTVLPPPVCVSAPTGAVAWWRGESNTLDSVSLNDAAFVNPSPNVASSFTAGKVGAAFSLRSGPIFSWSTDELNVGAGAGFTVEGWIRPDSVSGTKPVVEWNDGRGNIGAGLAVYSGRVEAYLTDTNSSPVRRVLLRSPAGAVTNAIWQHVALTFDKTSGLAQVFVNGVSLAQTNLGTFQPQTQSPVYLGYRPTGSYYFMGGLDEFTVYNRPLAPGELQGIITADEAGKCLLPPPPCAALPGGFVAWWRGESNTLDSVSDNHGIVTPTVVFTNGAAGKAFQFNGGYVRVPASDALNVGTGEGFTIEAWVKPASSSAQPLMQWNNGTGIQGVSLSTYGTLALRANILDSQGGSHYVTSPSGVLASGSFQHVALTYDKTSGVAALYVRGSLIKQTNLGSFTPRTTSDLYLGYHPAWSVRFTGALDEVSLYGRALTAAEIRAVAKARDTGKCFESPAIVQQPASLQVAEGETATFSVTAAGNPLLRYQWQSTGTNLSGATQSSLTLTNVQRDQAGSYSVTVTNAAGSITSSNAILTVGPPLPALRIVSTNAAAGETIAVPVVLAANGNENALMFSLSFNPAHLSYAGVVLGSGAPGGSLLFNAGQIGSGRLGVAVALPADATFAAGTHEVVQVLFTAAALTNDTASPVSFGDQPIARQLSDAFYHGLAATYADGQVNIAALDYEGDVAPRPDGDHNTTITDWVLAGRYAARLDYPTNASEFQRADSAPRASLGDGAIKITDWVQAGRYAVGLDPLTPVGGPTSEVAGAPRSPKDPPTCRVRASDVVFVQGHAGTLSVLLEAQGNEAGLGFSLAFDPARLTYLGAALGSNANGASLNVNANQVAAGRLGLGLMLPAGTCFVAGTQEIVKVTFAAAATGDCAVAFGDLPVPRDVSDVSAGTLTASYLNSSVTVIPTPALTITKQGQDLTLSWPTWATNFALQAVEGGIPLSGQWTNVEVMPGRTNGENTVTLPLSGSARFYRLRQP